jgi:hypothetical protein
MCPAHRRESIRQMESEFIDTSYGNTEKEARKLFYECAMSNYARIKSMKKITPVRLTQEELRRQHRERQKYSQNNKS